VSTGETLRALGAAVRARASGPVGDRRTLTCDRCERKAIHCWPCGYVWTAVPLPRLAEVIACPNCGTNLI
jgi:hypothetical protein